jgi:hypothetical protein
MEAAKTKCRARMGLSGIHDFHEFRSWIPDHRPRNFCSATIGISAPSKNLIPRPNQKDTPCPEIKVIDLGAPSGYQ